MSGARKNIYNKYSLQAFFLVCVYMLCPQVMAASHPDTVLLWESEVFEDFCSDSSAYDAFFSMFRDDLEGNDPLRISDAEHDASIMAYVQLRDSWFHSGNLPNFRMSLVVTRGLFQLLGFEIDATLRSTNNSNDSLRGRSFDKQIALPKGELFDVLDAHVTELGNYRPLASFNNPDPVIPNSAAWSSYIKQFGLSYRIWGSLEYLSRTENDPLFLQLTCFRDHLRTFQAETLVQRCASLVDLHEKLTLWYSVFDRFGPLEIDQMTMAKMREKLGGEFFFTETREPMREGVHALEGLDYIAAGVIGWRCPRLIDTSCE